MISYNLQSGNVLLSLSFSYFIGFSNVNNQCQCQFPLTSYILNFFPSIIFWVYVRRSSPMPLLPSHEDTLVEASCPVLNKGFLKKLERNMEELRKQDLCNESGHSREVGALSMWVTWPQGSRKPRQPPAAWQKVTTTVGKSLEPAFPMGVLMQWEKRGKQPYRIEESRSEAINSKFTWQDHIHYYN